MPRAIDLHPQKRGAGETSLYNPLRSQLDWQSAIGDTAEQAGGMIGGIFGGIDLLDGDGNLLDQPLLSWGLSLLTAPFNVGLDWLLELLGIDPGDTDDASRERVEGWFANLRSFLPLPFVDPLFDVGEAAIDFIFDILEPTGLLALLDPFTALLSAFNIPGLDASKIISGEFAIDMIAGLADMLLGFVSHIPILDQLIGVLPGIGDGLAGLEGFGSIFGDVFGLLGAPSGLGSGAPLLPDLSNIPILGGLFGLGGTLLGGLIPGLDASQITSGFFPLDMILGLPSMLAGFLTGDSPLSALNLFGTLPANLFGVVPIGSLVNTQTNVMPLGEFPTDSIAANPEWQIDLSHTYDADSTGSARVIADGTEHGLRGIPIPVQAGQTWRFSAQTEWSALAVSGGSPIQLGVVAFNGPAMVAYTMLDSIAAPAASSGWTELAGDYPVPPAGVDTIRVRLVLAANALAGNVWFDHVIGNPAGLIAVDWVDGLPGQLGGVLDLFGLGELDDLIGLDAGGVWANAIDLIINPLEMLAPLIGGFIPGLNIPGLDASKIISGEFAMDLVTGLLDFLDIFAGGTGLLSNAANAWTNLLSMFNIANPLTLITSPGSFDPGELLSTWIELALTPLELLAPLVGGLVPGGNIPGLDASKIVSGALAPAITGLQTLINGVLGGTSGTIPGLASNLLGTGTNLLAGFANMFDNWFGGSAATGTPAEVAETVESIRIVTKDGYTLQTFTSSTSYTVPQSLKNAEVAWAGAIGGGGKGQPGGTITGTNADTSPSFGGIGGTSGGYIVKSFDGGSLGASLSVTIGAAATTNGANGGTTSIGSLVSSTAATSGISTPQGYQASTSKPGEGGRGGDAYPGAARSGERGESSATDSGGAGGNGVSGTGTVNGSPGGAGTSGNTGGLPLSGGSGGGGGGAGRTASGIGFSATGGAGGSGAFPGGGSGGGGAASAGTTATGGASGTPGNGFAFLLWK